MRLNITYTLAGAEPVTVRCGYAAQSAVEKRTGKALQTLVRDGVPQEVWAYMAWAQAVRDQKYGKDFATFDAALDDVELAVPDTADDPTPGTEPPPDS